MLRKNAMRRALVLGLLLLQSAGCKDEPPTPADPLDDPWVDGLDEEIAADEPAPAAPANVEAPAAPAPPVPAAGPPEDSTPPNPDAAPEQPAAEDEAPVPAKTPTNKPATDKAPSKAPAKETPKAEPPEPDTPEPAKAAEAPSEPAQPEPEPEVAPTPKIDPAPTPPTPPPLTVADFAGKYRYVGGERQRKMLEQAIEGAAQELSIVIRKIGRKRLTETNPIDPTLEIVVTGDRVKTIFSKSGFDAECKVDGPSVSYTSKKGKKLKVRIRQSKNKLVQSIADSDGVKTTVFVLSKDRKRLTVHHKVTADRLDSPMTYKLSYTRQ